MALPYDYISGQAFSANGIVDRAVMFLRNGLFKIRSKNWLVTGKLNHNLSRFFVATLRFESQRGNRWFA